MNLYIGLDAHSTSSTFVGIDGSGKEIFCQTMPSTEKELRGFLKSQKGLKHLAFEESNLSRWAYVCLKPVVDRLIVCAPQYFQKKPGPKTDERDARYLAHELRNGNLVEVYHHEADKLLELRSLVAGYDDVIGDLVRCKNRFKSIFRSQALIKHEKGFYSDASVISELRSQWDQFNADSLMFRIGMLEETKKRYAELFEENVKKEKAIKLLTTIPGIDVIRANQIAALTCDAKRFKNKHRYWSYCMLIKHKQISNNKIYGQKHVHGRSELKSIFMGCALNQISGKTTFRDFYDKLISQKLNDKQARKMLARKTAAVALAVMKQGRRYSDDWEKEEQRILKGK